jgi:hypothetical protein
MAWNTIREKKSEVKNMTASKIVEMPSPTKATSNVSNEENLKSGLSRNKEKDLAGGMEILDLDFLLSIVENTNGNDKNDVVMRRLTFDELIRREQSDTIDSNALKVYAMNEDNLYNKVIQCEAMKVLTERTTRKSKHGD